MSDRIDQLEYTVMELGAEMFRLKQELQHITSMKENMLSVLKKLQFILDEKGIIDSEEFDMATSLNHFLSSLSDNLDDIDEENIPGKHELH
ncbi:MAG: hypothetical protein ACOH5I_14640 [Oligoflexus sp.]